MSYTVIARKYRPQRFADITAQEHITRTLQNAIRTGRIAHGYIFAGSRGVGKTTSARILAKALNCEKILTDETYRQKVAEPCGMCESCQDFDAGASVNIAEFDAASNNSVEDIRILRENVRYGPQKGKYKVYIIDEFHMLSTAAFNAFLKTLEEPPPHAVFIFATTELHKVPATISSRCQKFIFKRIAADDIAQRLAQICQQEHIDIDQESLNLIARKADGAMRDAQSLLDQVIAFCTESGKGKIEYAAVADLLNIIDDERFFDVSDAILEQDSRKMLSVSQFVYQNGFDVSDFLQRLIAHFRNFLIVKNVRSTKLIETAEHWKKRYEKDAERFSTDALMRYIDAITEAEQSIRFAREPQLRLEILLFKLMALKDNSELEARLAKVEQAVQLLQEEIKKKEFGTRLEPRTAVSTTEAPSPKSETASIPPTALLLESLPVIKLSSWKEKFAKLVEETPYRPKVRPDRAALATPEHQLALTSQNRSSISDQELQERWIEFLQSLEQNGQARLASHLRLCTLTEVHANTLKLKCTSRVVYETLLDDLHILSEGARAFYQANVFFELSLDKTALSAAKEENSLEARFKALAEKSELVRYLITEFGAELSY